MTLGILAAMEQEISLVCEMIENPVRTELGGRTFYRGKLNGIDCVVCFSKWGKVAAAITTTLMIEHFHITCVTNPTPGDRIWIAAGDNGRKDDYVFDPAFIYHFTVAMNGQNDGVTIEMTPNTTDPTIMVAPNALSMSAILGNPNQEDKGGDGKH